MRGKKPLKRKLRGFRAVCYCLQRCDFPVLGRRGLVEQNVCKVALNGRLFLFLATSQGERPAVYAQKSVFYCTPMTKWQQAVKLISADSADFSLQFKLAL